jgi:DHA2 family multidrug resistance protein
MFGGALIGRLLHVREATHANVLLDQAANVHRSVAVNTSDAFIDVALRVSHQAFVLSIADSYMALGVLALLLVPLVLALEYIAPPVIAKTKH